MVKHWSIILALVLMLACLVCTAAADGDAHGLIIENWEEETRTLFAPGSYDNVYIWENISDINLPNADEIFGSYDAVSWYAVVTTDNPDASAHLVYWDDGRWGGYIALDTVPEYETDVNFAIQVIWDCRNGASYSDTVNTLVHFVDMPMPTDSSLDYVYYVQVGDTLYLDGCLLVDDQVWHGDAYSIWADTDRLGNYADFVHFPEDENGNTVALGKLTFNQPGAVTMWINLEQDGASAGHNVTFVIADENGVQPEPEMDIWWEDGIIRTMFEPGSSPADSIFVHGALSSFYINNADTLNALYGGGWYAEVETDAPGAEAHMEYFDDQWAGWVCADHVPDAPGNAVFNVRVYWERPNQEPLTKDFSFTVKYVNRPLPDTDGLESVAHVQVGDENAFFGELFLNGQHWGEGYTNTQIDQELLGSLLRFEYVENDGFNLFHLFFDEPGVFSFPVTTNCDGVDYSRYVTFCVADETGLQPEPEMDIWWEDGIIRTMFEPGSSPTDSIFVHGALSSFYINNAHTLNALYGGGWYAEVETDAPGAEAHMEYFDDQWAGWVCADHVPDAPGNAVFNVRVYWERPNQEPLTKDFSFTVKYVNRPLPDTDGLESVAHVQVGDENAFFGELFLNGQHWGEGYTNTQIDQDLLASQLRFAYLDNDSFNLFHLFFDEPGIFSFPVTTNCDGVDYSRYVTFYVADENGGEETLVPSIRLDQENLTRTLLPLEWHNTRNYTMGNSGFLTDLWIDNYDALVNVYGEQQPDYGIIPYENSFDATIMYTDNPRHYILQLDNPPETEGERTTSVYYRWGDQEVSVDLTVNFVNRPWPAGIDLAPITWHVNDTDYFYGYFTGDGWGENVPTDTYFDTDAVSDHISAVHKVIGDNNGYFLRFISPGIITTQVSVYSDGIEYTGYMTWTILDENDEFGDMPELAFVAGDTIDFKPIMDAPVGPWSVDSYLMSLDLTNEQTYIAATGTEPVITITQTSGVNTAVYVDDENTLRLQDFYNVSSPVDNVYSVKAQFGDQYSVETTLTVVYFACDLPESTGFETEYTLHIGDTMELYTNFDSGNWASEFHGMWVMDGVGEAVYAESIFADVDHIGIIANHVGDTVIDVEANQDGLTWHGSITFHVIVDDWLRLPAGLTDIEAEAFAGVNAEAVEIYGGCLTIGDRAFADCGRLRALSIPASVTFIAESALEGCPNEITIITPEGSYAYNWAAEHGCPVE